jgi:hypothetical protein
LGIHLIQFTYNIPPSLVGGGLKVGVQPVYYYKTARKRKFTRRKDMRVRKK